eukprot:8560717-Lingulodinium_polyedra.AAC.1
MPWGAVFADKFNHAYEATAFVERFNHSFAATLDDPPDEEPLGSRAISFGEKAGTLPVDARVQLRRFR